MSKHIIYKNNSFTVTVGESQMLEGAMVYICTNNITGVVEAEEQMLPRIIDYAEQLNDKIGEMVLEGVELYPDERQTTVSPPNANHH